MNQTAPSFSWMAQHPYRMLAFGFGTGLSKYAPGTMGTLLGLPLFFFFSVMPAVWYGLTVLALIFLSIHICDQVSRELGVHDHPGIVLDEVAGYLVACFLLPFSIQNMLLAFVAFRFFDIVKPWPIGWVDRRCKGGVGIVLDDVIAGAMAGLVVHGLLVVSIDTEWLHFLR